jgi:hypothetical protein
MRLHWRFFWIALLALSAFSLVVAIPASAQTYLFNRAILQVQSLPEAVAAADLNSDGAVDLLAANSGSNTISVFKNQGNGRFSASPVVQTGGDPAALAVAQFNGDGKLDLAVANAADNTVSVFVGNGDTTFTLVSTAQVSLRPVSIVAADFNGDHNTDLAVADQDDNALAILLGNGNGTFTRVADVLTDSGPIVLVSGDLNRDGKPDLAVVAGTTVTPYLGNGDGTFTAQASLSASPQPVALVIGDFNGDSKSDLAVLNGAPPSKPSVLVFLGNGDGTFAFKSTFNASGLLPQGLTAADMNGDGKLDLVSSGKSYVDSSDHHGDMAVFLGAGDGTFKLFKQRFSINEAHEIVTADINNDGKFDVLGSYTFSNQLVLLVNQGDGQLFSTAEYPVGAFPIDAAAGDFNGDGFADISVLNANSGTISILLNNHDGTFHSASEVGVGGVGNSETVADFNGDGYPDLAATNGRGGVAVLLGNGDGTFQPAVPYTTGDPEIVLTGDFNGDGILDLIANNFNGATIAVLPGRGDGTFGPRILSPTSSGQPVGFAVGDLDGDGEIDAVLTYNFSTQLDVFRGNGDGTFSLFRTYTTEEFGDSIQIADLNADGKLDVVIGFGGEILIFDGNGDGTLQPPRRRTLKNGAWASHVRTLDWDHDGILDLAFTGGTFSIMRGRGNGSFGTEFVLGTFVFQAFAAGDFLGLGGTDVALTNDVGTITVLLNQPVIALASRRLVFGNQQVGTQSQPLSMKISNPGTVPIAMSAITATGDFSQTNDCGASIAIQGSCTVKVVFAPTQVGKRTGKLSINDKVPGSPQVVSLSGTGT